MRVTPFAPRLSWHLRAFGFNPLIRLTDRLEALAVLAVLVTALVAIPAAAHAGALAYEAGKRTADEQARSRHSVEAVVIEGTAMPRDLDTPAYVSAQWREGTETRTAAVVSPGTIKAGDQMTIWLNESGKVVAAPMEPGDAKLNAVVAAGTIWVAIVACSALVAFFIRRGLDRSRDRGWERELQLLAHNDDGWANRDI